MCPGKVKSNPSFSNKLLFRLGASKSISYDYIRTRAPTLNPVSFTQNKACSFAAGLELTRPNLFEPAYSQRDCGPFFGTLLAKN